MRNLRIKYVMIIMQIILITAIFIFFTKYFETHFYFGTTINGINVSCKTADAADRMLNNLISTYVLVLNERDSIKEQIMGSEIGLEFNQRVLP
jgi:hypothetical protein